MLRRNKQAQKPTNAVFQKFVSVPPLLWQDVGYVLGEAMLFPRPPGVHENSVGSFPLCLQGLLLCFQAESLMEPNIIIIIIFLISSSSYKAFFQ